MHGRVCVLPESVCMCTVHPTPAWSTTRMHNGWRKTAHHTASGFVCVRPSPGVFGGSAVPRPAVCWCGAGGAEPYVVPTGSPHTAWHPRDTRHAQRHPAAPCGVRKRRERNGVETVLSPSPNRHTRSHRPHSTSTARCAAFVGPSRCRALPHTAGTHHTPPAHPMAATRGGRRRRTAVHTQDRGRLWGVPVQRCARVRVCICKREASDAT